MQKSQKQLTAVKNVAKAIAMLFIAVFLISTLNAIGVTAKAENLDPVAVYEQSNVTDDLKGATENGQESDYSAYKFSDKRKVEIISFVEFCYSANPDKQGDYGLYVYVYNPRGQDWTDKEKLNKIQLRCGGKANVEFNKYNLKYLNCSKETGEEGLFYKFKLMLSETERAAIITSLSSKERIYEVGEIELNDGKGTAVAYSVANTYKYTGYANGYGSSAAAGATLKCTSTGLTALTLDVHPVQYRPDGSNGKNEYTQDMLHSVYFSIPNEILTEYGGLSSVHATWLNARTAPIFVTGNKEVYDAMYGPVHGSNGIPMNLEYCWAARARYSQIAGGRWSGDMYYGDTPNIWNGGMGDIDKSKYISLHYLFYAEGGNGDKNSADHYRLSGAELLKYMQEYTGGIISGPTEIKVAGKYKKSLFESYDKDYTDVTISADDKYSLTSEKITQHWWEKLFKVPGTQVESSTKYHGIEAIYPVEDDDFKSDEKKTCDELYIDTSNYKEFRAFYKQAKLHEETVFLFRYYQSEYESREVTEFKYQQILSDKRADLIKLDTNAYVAQETVNLDFDIIDVTCSKGEIETVIPIVSSPIEIIPDVTPPLITKEDDDFWEKLKKALMYVGIAVGAIIVIEVLVTLITTLSKRTEESDN